MENLPLGWEDFPAQLFNLDVQLPKNNTRNFSTNQHKTTR